MQMFLNLTPHPVNVYRDDELVLIIPSAGTIRLQERTEPSGTVAGVSVVSKTTDGISVVLSEDLPNLTSPTVVIVSRPVGEALARSPHLRTKLIRTLILKGFNVDTFVCPDTGEDSALRDENGNIYGVRRFCVFK